MLQFLYQMVHDVAVALIAQCIIEAWCNKH